MVLLKILHIVVGVNWYIVPKDFSAAKTFVEENKDQLGDYLSQAQALVSGSEGLDGLVDKVKGLF